MRAIEYPETESEEEEEKWFEEQTTSGMRSADWKENVEEVLSTIDEQLKEFGLEVVLVKDCGCWHMWKIEKRVEEEIGFGRRE